MNLVWLYFGQAKQPVLVGIATSVEKAGKMKQKVESISPSFRCVVELTPVDTVSICGDEYKF